MGAPTDGRVWEEGGDGSLRVLRGGSWFNSAGALGGADRYWFWADNRDRYNGFRVAVPQGSE